ncbi:MAG: phage-related protein, partial [Flavobacteriales bacterium]
MSGFQKKTPKTLKKEIEKAKHSIKEMLLEI